MENYEVKGVSQATEIRKAYEEAVKANAPKYRAVSKTNQYYGWDENTNKFIKAQIGQEWFDNPHYVAPIEEPIVEDMVEVANEMIEEVKVEEVAKEPEVDYKALYEESCIAQEKLINALAEKDKLIAKLELEKSTIKKEFDEYKAVVEAFKKL